MNLTERGLSVLWPHWYSADRELLQTLVDESQQDVSGEVRVKLYKGSLQIAGRRSDRSLYAPEYATFERDEVYRQADADGFIRLTSLRHRIRALRRGKTTS
jgi:argininosuccinate synthase